MMTSSTVLKYKNAQPFRPFRIHMTSGKTFDIRHPEMFQVSKSYLVIFSFVSDEPELLDDWDSVSLMLIEHISYLEVPAA